MTWHVENRLIGGNKTDLTSDPNFQISKEGTSQHLSGRRFVFLNGSILAIHLRSYNGQDLVSDMRI